MNRSGFALLAVLWVLTALTALTGAGLLVARIGSETTRNRILLARAEWAREACGEMLLARFAVDPTVRALDPIDLGRGTWCRATLEDPAAGLNLNTADRAALVQLFKAVGVQPTLAESVVVMRARSLLSDVRQVPGVDSAVAARLTAFVTVRGTGAVNVNAAPPEVLRTLPGIMEEGVFLLTSRRAMRPIHSADELAGLLSRSARTVFLNSYAEFVRAAAFSPPQLIAVVEGGVRGTPILARAVLTTVGVPGRLAVIRRETE
jgi:type II secretory pathway component PulK